MFKLYLMVSRACRDQDISGGDRDTGRTRASREVKGGIPNDIVDGEFRQQPFEIPNYLLIAIATCAIPQLQPDYGTPRGFAGIECAHHPVPDNNVSIRPEHMNPGGGVDQDHGNSAFATLLQEFLDAHQVLAGSRMLGQFGHPLTAVEFLDGSDDCLALRFRLGESNGVRKVAIGNINCGFHESTLSSRVFPVNDKWNTSDFGAGRAFRDGRADSGARRYP